MCILPYIYRLYTYIDYIYIDSMQLNDFTVLAVQLRKMLHILKVSLKGGGTGGARGAIAPPLFTDHQIINYSDTQNGS